MRSNQVPQDAGVSPEVRIQPGGQAAICIGPGGSQHSFPQEHRAHGPRVVEGR